MKVGGLTSIFKVCILNFIVFWVPGKFGLKKALGVTPLFLGGDIVTFFTVFCYSSALHKRVHQRWPRSIPSLTSTRN